VGAVHLDRAARRLDSVGVVRLERLDYVGVAITGAEPDLLRRYANGELDLTELIATIGAAP
jgi:hypothetical protein